MDLESYEKKRKRGKRGGRKLKEEEEFGKDENINQTPPDSNEEKEDLEGTKKKTRRSKTKQSYYEDTTGDNAGEINFQESIPNREDLVFLNPESKQYFLEIEQQLSTLEEEELSLLVENVFETIYEEKLELLKDFETSRIIEKLLDLAKVQQIVEFYKFIGVKGSPEDFNILIRDQFASHVLQKLLIVPSAMVESEILGHTVVRDGLDLDHSESLADLVISFAGITFIYCRASRKRRRFNVPHSCKFCISDFASSSFWTTRNIEYQS